MKCPDCGHQMAAITEQDCHLETCTPYLDCCLQYFELACMFYAKFIMVASCLLFLTIASSFVSTYKLYKKRSELFHAIGQQRLIPIVLEGRVRSDLLFV